MIINHRKYNIRTIATSHKTSTKLYIKSHCHRTIKLTFWSVVQCSLKSEVQKPADANSSKPIPWTKIYNNTFDSSSPYILISMRNFKSQYILSIKNIYKKRLFCCHEFPKTLSTVFECLMVWNSIFLRRRVSLPPLLIKETWSVQAGEK